MDLRKQLQTLSDRDRRILTFGVIFVFFYVLYIAAVRPLWNWHDSIVTELDNKTELLAEYRWVASKKSRTRRQVEGMDRLKRQLESYVLPGTTPELASAELSKIIKEIAGDNGLQITRITPRTNKEVGNFIIISASFPLLATTTKLKEFLYELESHQHLLMVQEVRIRPRRLRGSHEDQADFVVAGLIRNPYAENAEEG